MKRKPSYETLYNRFLAGIEKTKSVDYSDKASIRRNNAGVDQYREAAERIAELYRDRIDEFALLLNSNDVKERQCCAICMVEIMKVTDQKLKLALGEIKNYYDSYADEAEKMIIDVWLKKYDQ